MDSPIGIPRRTHRSPIGPVNVPFCRQLGAGTTTLTDGAQDRARVAASREAFRWAIASMVIMGFTPEAVGKVEPSHT